MKILICQVITPDIKDYAQYSIPTNIEYAIKHNYDFILYTSKKEEINYHPAWLKITSLRHLGLDKYDWIWVLDADAVINNQEITLEDIISREEKPIIISENGTNDGRTLNSGSILIQKSFVPNLLARYDTAVKENYRFLVERFWDQELINDWYEEDPSIFSVRPMTEINSHWRLHSSDRKEVEEFGIGFREPLDQTKNLVHHYMALPNFIRFLWMRKSWIARQMKKMGGNTFG